MRTRDLSVRHALVDQLREFRRRLIVVHLVEQMAVAVTATCVVWSAALAIAGPAPQRAVLWLALASVVAFASTVCRTMLQPWSLTTTAATVDRMFHLDERVTTALTCLDEGDAVSPLIVADAGRHLQACRRGDVRPAWRIDPRLAIASVAIALIAATVAVGRGSTAEDLGTPVTAGDSSMAGAAQAAGGRAASSRQTTGSVAAASTPRGDQATASRSEPGRPQSPAAGSRAASDRTSEPRNDGQNDRTAPRSAPTSGDVRAANPVSMAGEASAPAGSGVSESRTAGSGVNAGDQGRGNSAASPGGGSTIGSSARGGGVQGAPRLANTDRGRITSPDATLSSAERYHLAAQAAESPVAQERIPDRLRGYVRDYFLAMRPAPGRGDAR